VKYAFMAQHCARWPVRLMCQVLDISPSGFYTAHRRGTRAHHGTGGKVLLERVRAIHHATGQSYGGRRMARQLQDEGYPVGRYKARRLMRQAGVVVRSRKRFKVMTEGRHTYPVAPHVLARQFDVDQPNQVWAGDITYLWTAEGWRYLAVGMDLYSRKIVGWALSSRLIVELVQEA
jgi:putative transposase